jgi:hypothetical protein
MNMAKITRDRLLYAGYIGYLLVLSTSYQYLNGGFEKRSYLESWPELMGDMFLLFAFGGIVYLLRCIFNKGNVKESMLYSFSITATVLALLAMLSAYFR